MKKNYVLGLALSAIMLLTACGGGAKAPDKNEGGETKEETKVEETAKTDDSSEKSLRMLFDKQGEGTNFDTPWWNRGDIYKVITFRSLFKANPELTEFNEDLLDNYTMADDGMSYEFNIKDGLKWSDGSDLTAEDVKFSIEGALKGAKVNSIYKSASRVQKILKKEKLKK